ncbi:anhydro-N-acetylmuramic acid kinase [Solemya pervernicosa gill symbiont]|uniref:Anhydro-N-acetylmuramic acid kinase n=2 Tax=Gammaproteobacteria incertae sedis TaxID=118884 RepID=A0A1T2L5B9_9GAMM|nr:anhydro-N-acetylmuramic acid kinase [Candidatus Reidiella endopervernicosa]OOZ40254.1 anhydro-N-acetylmuramic acid kinase [Solemya pervernicosa gill symbiont]QKQ26050.1 anhydro-N-acetylmuramic acid kinase [Candidatus Reidiella endopervernicosa]
MPSLYIGLMSGTSLDAIDAALIELDDTQCKLIATHNHDWPISLRHDLLTLCKDPNTSLQHLGEADTACGELFAEAVEQLLQKSEYTFDAVRAIGSHGQTIFHSPSGKHPFSMQIGNASLIAERTGITTVADFRSRDIAAGGEGAPLVPAFHAALLRSSNRERVIANIGGIANITRLTTSSDDEILGFDTGPGNVLMDSWAARHLDSPLDFDGNWARSGQVDQQLLAALSSEPYFDLAPPKSTGRELFNIDWLDAILANEQREIPIANVQRTLCELTAATLCDAARSCSAIGSELIICGGGVHNSALLDAINNNLPGYQVTTTAEHGVDPDWVEAMAFAWLAAQTLDNKPGNLPSVTGANHPAVLGAIHPGG